MALENGTELAFLGEMASALAREREGQPPRWGSLCGGENEQLSRATRKTPSSPNYDSGPCHT
eukprot:4937743-Pyramimonas_sp.AAC.1